MITWHNNNVCVKLRLFISEITYLLESLSGDKTVVMVNTFGTVKFEGNPPKVFSETFFLINKVF